MRFESLTLTYAMSWIPLILKFVAETSWFVFPVVFVLYKRMDGVLPVVD